jgi:hypothetical protein
LKRFIKSLAQRCGLQIRRKTPPRPTADMREEFFPLWEQCKDYTMTSVARMYALYEAVRYVVDAGVEGDVVECGVWQLPLAASPVPPTHT